MSDETKYGMKFILPAIEQREIPKGKRKIRQNIWGNWVGYIGRERFKEFGYRASAESEALNWLNEGVENGKRK